MSSRTRQRKPATPTTPRTFTCRVVEPLIQLARDETGGWGTRSLGFIVGPPPPNVAVATFVAAIQQALSIWTQAVPFNFAVGAGPLFVAGVPANHGDGLNFGGAASELAHAFGPVTGGGELDGQVHLNNLKTWANGGGADADLVTVILHELGHALGIVRHADGDPLAVMNGSFPPGLIRRTLVASDVTSMRALYP